MVFAERGLHRVKLIARGETFNCRDLAAFRLRREHGACLDGNAVDMDDAGAALARIATDMRAGKAERFAEELDEKRARLDRAGHGLAVDRHRDGRSGGGGHRLSLSPQISLERVW